MKIETTDEKTISDDDPRGHRGWLHPEISDPGELRSRRGQLDSLTPQRKWKVFGGYFLGGWTLNLGRNEDEISGEGLTTSLSSADFVTSPHRKQRWDFEVPEVWTAKHPGGRSLFAKSQFLQDLWEYTTNYLYLSNTCQSRWSAFVFVFVAMKS